MRRGRGTFDHFFKLKMKQKTQFHFHLFYRRIFFFAFHPRSHSRTFYCKSLYTVVKDT